jgi:ribose transport system substrate-binding protein
MTRSRSIHLAGQRPRAVERRVAAVAPLLVSAALLLSACSSSGSSATSAGTGSPSTASNSKKLNLGYFVFAAQNSYEAPQIAAVQKEASAENAGVTVFDATSNAQKQYGQIQDAIASGKYDGFLIDSVDGAGLVPIVQQAMSQHIKVVALNTVLGPDLTKGAPQIAGVSASVVYTAYDRGQHEGKLVEQACATVQSGDCNVGYMYDIKASGFDQGVRSGLNSVISSNPKIHVVAEGEDMFSATGGLASSQTMLQAHPDINVIVGSDQGMQGATQALTAAQKLAKVKIIGLGGSVAGLARVKAGTWFGTVLSLPASQGRLAAQAIVKAIRSGVDSGGINPAASLPDSGLATQANVGKFTGEWSG